MAEEVTKPAAQAKARTKVWTLANGKILLDVNTVHGSMRVTNEKLANDKFVAMLQAKAPNVFAAGLIVEK